MREEWFGSEGRKVRPLERSARLKISSVSSRARSYSLLVVSLVLWQVSKEPDQ